MAGDGWRHVISGGPTRPHILTCGEFCNDENICVEAHERWLPEILPPVEKGS